MNDLLITGARVWDGSVLRDTDAVWIEDGRIRATGRAAALAAHASGAPRWDAAGATLTPALCDAHVHLAPWARALVQLDLRGARTRAEALDRVRAAALAQPTGTLIGRGWDESHWEAPPDRHALDAVSGGRAVLLHRHDFHALWVSTAALRAAGISRETPDPAGGRHERDADGEPLGVAREHAVRAFHALEAEAEPPLDDALAEAAVAALHARGITAVHDFQRSAAEMRWSQRLAQRGRLRVVQHFGVEQLAGLESAGVTSGIGDAWFRIGALKLFADGTLGSRTAAMLAPYDDGAGAGLDLLPPAELTALVARAFAARLSVTVHAIGDRAVRRTLDAIEAAGEAARAALALPPRIEHAQLVDPTDLDRFAPLGVVASMQPQHAVTDWEAATRAWGARVSSSYPWQALLARGVPLAFGSDAPVEPPDPWLGLHACVTRQRPDGTPQGGFVPEQRVSLDAALVAYTRGSARAGGGSEAQGTLAPGAVGDVVVWDRDLHGASPDDLLTARPACTVLSGRIVYQSSGSGSRAGERARTGAAP